MTPIIHIASSKFELNMHKQEMIAEIELPNDFVFVMINWLISDPAVFG